MHRAQRTGHPVQHPHQTSQLWSCMHSAHQEPGYEASHAHTQGFDPTAVNVSVTGLLVRWVVGRAANYQPTLYSLVCSLHWPTTLASFHICRFTCRLLTLANHEFSNKETMHLVHHQFTTCVLHDVQNLETFGNCHLSCCDTCQAIPI